MQEPSEIIKEFMEWKPSEAFLELVSNFQAISSEPSEARLQEWEEAIFQRRRDRGQLPFLTPDLEECHRLLVAIRATTRFTAVALN